MVKRGAKLSSHPFNTIKEVHFKTHGKDFRLILHPHSSVLHSNFKAYAVDGDGKETTVHVGKIRVQKYLELPMNSVGVCRNLPKLVNLPVQANLENM